MREIKFRAWAHASKTMFYPDTEDGWELLKGIVHPLPNTTLMHCTGLTDKNGKEIYEGDVVRVLYTDWPSNPAPNNEGLAEYKKSISKIGRVDWYRDGYELNFGQGKYGEDEHGPLRPGAHGEMEIIGNIYENPKLIR